MILNNIVIFFDDLYRLALLLFYFADIFAFVAKFLRQSPICGLHR